VLSTGRVRLLSVYHECGISVLCSVISLPQCPVSFEVVPGQWRGQLREQEGVAAQWRDEGETRSRGMLKVLSV
jgi:hypothetical protein